MKRMIIFIVLLTSIVVLISVIIIKADNEVLTKEKALSLGEEKYLKFLWMVDGAFNNERLNEEFTVNDKKLSNDEKIFTCKYKNNKSIECIGNNFDKEFNKLFLRKINYQKVYSDGLLYSWITIKDGQYVFNNLNSCNINRMGVNHKLTVMNIDDKKIIYEVLFTNRQTNKIIKRDFVLELEDNEWKISSAFYYDLCGMRYTIY